MKNDTGNEEPSLLDRKRQPDVRRSAEELCEKWGTIKLWHSL
jgi:hypothetical protein